MKTTSKLKLTTIAIAQIFLLGSMQAYAANNTSAGDKYQKNFKSQDNNEDGLLDRNEVADDDIFEGMEANDASKRWDLVDSNNDGFWDENEYISWYEYESMDANADGLLDRNEVIDADVFDGMDEGIYNNRWKISDGNGDGFWDHNEYMRYQSEFGT